MQNIMDQVSCEFGKSNNCHDYDYYCYDANTNYHPLEVIRCPFQQIKGIWDI